MALKLKGATAPAPERDTHFELAQKDGVIFLRAITADGKKFRLLDVTKDGIKLRPRNTHANLGVKVDRNGAPTVT